MKYILIFLITISLSCNFFVQKKSENNLNKNLYSNCFFKDNEYTIIQYRNLSEVEVRILRIIPVLDKDFNLIPTYYELSNDTLLIKPVSESNISLSYSSKDTKINVRNNDIILEKGKSIQQGFILNKKFNVINFDNKYFIEKCL